VRSLLLANSSIALKAAISTDAQSLFVMTESAEPEKAVKPWALAKITFENNLFVHTSLRTFFTQDGAEKHYCLAQGLEWSGGETVDDYD
jgi:hypothetical protein